MSVDSKESLAHRPIHIRKYFQLFRQDNEKKLNDCKVQLIELENLNKATRKQVTEIIPFYANYYGLVLPNYNEWNENKYIDGKFVKLTKTLYNPDEEDTDKKLKANLLIRYANTLVKLDNIYNKIDLYQKLVNLRFTEYNEYVKRYYCQVQKELISYGNAYHFSNRLGTLFINRVKFKTKSKKLDFAATKKNKEKLIAEGKELFNKDKAKFCKENNIEYNGVDYRIYLQNDGVFNEFVLLDCTADGEHSHTFEVSDYRSADIRGKSNDDIAEEYKDNVNGVLDLDLDMRTKVNIMQKIDKTLYIKFVRSDEQKSIARPQDSR